MRRSLCSPLPSAEETCKISSALEGAGSTAAAAPSRDEGATAAGSRQPLIRLGATRGGATPCRACCAATVAGQAAAANGESPVAATAT